MARTPAASDWRPGRDRNPGQDGNPGRITVVGLGLLGASLAEAARKRWPGLLVTGVSSPSTLEKARVAGLLDDTHPYAEIDAACADADLVILCTPIDHIKTLLATWAMRPPVCKPGCVITDVGSTKAEICALGRKAFPSLNDALASSAMSAGAGVKRSEAVFIGSHPMAGSEKTGLEARDALLFQNASWVLCPSEGDADPSEAEGLARLENFAQGLGARTTRMTSGLHDRVAAHVSHLPQLLSTALASYVGDKRAVVENCLQIAGGGFRDMTRLAASSFAVWEPILRSNIEEIREVISGFREHLAALETALEKDLGSGYFRAGNSLRGQLSTARKGFTSSLAEILVDLEDKPGMLVRVFGPLADNGVNVLDVEILKVREGEGGTLMLGFRGNDEAQAALDCLAAAGFRARPR
jgi:prephenate dehydrogenase